MGPQSGRKSGGARVIYYHLISDEVVVLLFLYTGSTASARKVPTIIHFDPDVLGSLRATGLGWQTHANEALREWLRERQLLSS